MRPPEIRFARLAAVCAVALATALPVPSRAEGRRSPGLAFVLSAVLPGAGQLYLGERRAYVYLGADAAAWFARSSYRGAARTQERSFRSFAQRHWSIATFSSRDHETWSAADSVRIAELLASGSSQFYDEIGRKDAYRGGWDDFGTLQQNRGKFQDMRSRKSDLDSNARIAMVGLVLNRLVSSMDALRSARGRTGDPPRVRLEGGIEGEWSSPQAVVRLVRVLP